MNALTLDRFRLSIRGLDRAAFLLRFRHPFLLVEIKLDDPDDKFHTVVVSGDSSAPVASGPGADADDLEGSFVHPIAKRDVNKFSGMITLGRAANNDISINDASISKFHAYFTPSNEHWMLADAGSSNGTFVKGRRLNGAGDPVQLGDSTVILFGQHITARFFNAPTFYEVVMRMR